MKAIFYACLGIMLVVLALVYSNSSPVNETPAKPTSQSQPSNSLNNGLSSLGK